MFPSVAFSNGKYEKVFCRLISCDSKNNITETSYIFVKDMTTKKDTQYTFPAGSPVNKPFFLERGHDYYISFQAKKHEAKEIHIEHFKLADTVSFSAICLNDIMPLDHPDNAIEIKGSVLQEKNNKAVLNARIEIRNVCDSSKAEIQVGTDGCFSYTLRPDCSYIIEIMASGYMSQQFVVQHVKDLDLKTLSNVRLKKSIKVH